MICEIKNMYNTLLASLAMVIPMVYFLFRFDSFLLRVSGYFQNSQKFCFRSDISLLKVNGNNYHSGISSKLHFFSLVSYFSMYVLKILVIMVRGSFFTRLQLPLQPWLQLFSKLPIKIINLRAAYTPNREYWLHLSLFLVF